MSLGRLLTAGKSLIGIQDATSRYRMREKNLLPKFGSNKNPFAPPPPAPAAPLSTPATLFSAHQTPAPQPAPVASPDTGPKGTKRLPTIPPAKKTSEPKAVAQGTSTLAQAVNSVREGTQKFISKIREASRRTKPKSPAPRFGKAPVQGELSLDHVKVVRNDLSEADAEMPSAPKSKARREPVEAAGQKLEFVETQS